MTFVPYSIRTAQTGSNGWGVQEHQSHTLDGASQAVAYGIRGTLTSRAANKGGPGGTGVTEEQSWPLNVTEEHAVSAGMSVRRLTPTECERLQSFPDGWTAGFADSVRYKMLGNAVCVDVAEWLGRRILDHG